MNVSHKIQGFLGICKCCIIQGVNQLSVQVVLLFLSVLACVCFFLLFFFFYSFLEGREGWDGMGMRGKGGGVQRCHVQTTILLDHEIYKWKMTMA